MKRLFLSFVIAGIIFYSAPVRGEITIPHTFQSGTPANASEVNENFEALKTGIESQLPQEFSGTYTLPFSSSGALADRNVLILKYEESSNIDYRLRIRFNNSEGFTISTNGTPTVYDYIGMYIYVHVDSGGNITSITSYIHGLDEPYGGPSWTAFTETSSYNPSDLSQTITNDTEKYYRRYLSSYRQSLPLHFIETTMLSADDSVLGGSSNALLSSLLGESIELNGMTFSDVRVDTYYKSDSFNLQAKDIGRILASSSSATYTIIYYRVNGTSGGNLTGTPFASGGDLEGLFFSP